MFLNQKHYNTGDHTMPGLDDLVMAAYDPLKDPLFLIVIIICIILILLSAVIGTIIGRKKRAEVETRIAERRKQRRVDQDQAIQREKDMLKRYADAKSKAEEEMRTNPRPIGNIETVSDEEVRAVPRGGGRVELLSTTGPRYMKVQGELGVSGSAPVRLSTRDTVGVQGSRFTDTGETQSAKMAKAKPIAGGARPGPPKAVAVAKPAVQPGPPKAEQDAAKKAVEARQEAAKKTAEDQQRLAKEAAEKERAEKERIAKEAAEKERADKEKAVKEKPAKEKSEDEGLNQLQEMLTNLDKMKR